MVINKRKDMKIFIIGDKVKLKSGSPIMTIDFIGLENAITCKWFNSKEYQEEIFDKHSLTIYVNEE